LVQNIPSIVFREYNDGNVEFVDNKIEVLTGYSKEELIGKLQTTLEGFFK